MSFSFEKCPKRKLYAQKSPWGLEQFPGLGRGGPPSASLATAASSWAFLWVLSFATSWAGFGRSQVGKLPPRVLPGQGKVAASGAQAWGRQWKDFCAQAAACVLCLSKSCMSARPWNRAGCSQSFRKQQMRHPYPDPSLGAAGPQGVHLLCPK